MVIEKKTFLYEVLIRFDPNGYVGAHVVDLQTVVDTESGEVFTANERPARAVTLEEVGSLIGEANAKFIEQFDAAVALRTQDLKAALDEANARVEALQVELQALA